MGKRTSVVTSTKVSSISLSSVFQIGDSVQIIPRNKALAVQRQLQLFYGNEGNLTIYPIFTKELPHLASVESITIQRYNQTNFIKVNHIDITSVSASSVYHIGSTCHIDAETRIKHIRHIQELPEEIS